MKLLFLAHRIPFPPNKGDKIRSYHELRALVERGHEVHLLAFADDARDLGYQADLSGLCASVKIVPLNRLRSQIRAIAEIPLGKPLSLSYFASSQMRGLVRDALNAADFDAVFVYSTPMSQYIPREFRSRTILDLVDVDSEKWRDYAVHHGLPKSIGYELEWKRFRRYEHQVVSQFASSIVTTEREAVLLDGLDEFTRRARLRIITNGVDLDYFRPSGFEDGAMDTSSPRLVFAGAMDYYANIDGVRWFVDDVLPLIRAREPRAKLYIVGSNPSGEVMRLGAHDGVTITGYVDDMRPYLRGSVCSIVPLRIARGVQNKVLEAMAMGKAIVATPQSTAGLTATNDQHLLIARDPGGFAESVLAVINDARLRQSLGAEARYFVESEHDWAPLLRKFVDLIESVAEKRATVEKERTRNTLNKQKARNQDV